jgi:CheY-like chemotaxis protein
MGEQSSYFEALGGEIPIGFFTHSTSLAAGVNVTGNQVGVIGSKDGIAGAIRDRGRELAGGSRDGVPSLTRIVLINDQLKVLAGLRELIEQNPDLAVVAACRCADGAMLAVQKYRPEVVILDVRLPDRDGVELIRDITAVSEAKVIVFESKDRQCITERCQGDRL